jgi:hypothetical protein
MNKGYIHLDLEESLRAEVIDLNKTTTAAQGKPLYTSVMCVILSLSRAVETNDESTRKREDLAQAVHQFRRPYAVRIRGGTSPKSEFLGNRAHL